MRKILITSALPYANGSIHLGHLVEYIQTDIWVRFHKMQQNEAYYFCADDTHGTPIMLAAQKEGISPEELIDRVHKEHYRDLTAFQIEFTNYHSTNSAENQELANLFFERFKQKGHIYEQEIEQAYCEHDRMFLPDRFIKGKCPKCGAEDQNGDSCEVCGTTYSPLELAESYCAICGQKPVVKRSSHYFFRLSDFAEALKKWHSEGDHVNQGVSRKMDEWFQAGLNDWDISRDGPYFGFRIPGEEDKFFYVWMDAPIGYIASSRNYFDRVKPDYFEKFWHKDSDWEVYHFIGKDIMYFHTLFWPAQLMGADFKVPDGVFVHGFLTVNGEKMSKSKGTFIQAETYLKHLDTSYLRYYYASKLTDSMEDIDLNLEDFLYKNNSDLVGNFINILSRLGGSIGKKFDYHLSSPEEEGERLLQDLLGHKEEIVELYEKRNFARVVREITALGDKVNKFINEKEPWAVVKNDVETARRIATTGLNGARIIAAYLKPIVPELVEQIEQQLDIEPLTFANLDQFMIDHTFKPYKHLLKRIEQKYIDNMLEDSKKSLAPAKKGGSENSAEDSGVISIEELFQVDLRIGQIISAAEVQGADKLLQLRVDVGELGQKNIFAGLKQAYSAEELVSKKIAVVANLKPRKMKFGVSEAMLLATGDKESISLVVPDRQAKPGERLK